MTIGRPGIVGPHSAISVLAGFSLVIALIAFSTTWVGCGIAPRKVETGTASGIVASGERAVLKDPERVLIIGNIPSENVLDKSSRYVPLCRFLEGKVGVRFQFKFEPDYDSIVRGMKQREYHLVMPGSLGYVKGRDAGYRAILAPVSKAPYYLGSIITRADSGIATLSELAGKKICFVDQGSTSGYLYPMVLLREHGLVPGKDFTFGFVKGHDNVALNVFLKQYDAGACFDGAHREAFRNEPEKADQLKVIALTDRIYSAPLAVRDDIDPGLVASFVQVFRTFPESPEGKEVLAVLGKNLTGYVEVSDADYDGVRKMLQYELDLKEHH